MQVFTNWILSITGIILLGVLVDLIIPEGQTNKYIKSIFSIVVIFVIVTPLVKITKNDIDVDSILNTELQIDREYIDKVNSSRLIALNESILKEAENFGLKNFEVEFVLDDDSINLKILNVNLYLGNLVIDENFTHIDKYKVLIGVVQKYVTLEEDNIIFYE